MSQQNIKRLVSLFKQMHYSSAFIQHLINTIQSTQDINTMQQLNQLIENEGRNIIQYFKSNPSERKLIEFKNPLCLQSIREYFNRVMIGLLKQKYSSINQFKTKLCDAAKNLIKVIALSTTKLAQNASIFWNEQTNRKIITYSYSKSIVQSLKRYAQLLQNSMTVYICQSGPMGQGLKTYKELSTENIKCQLISDNEVAYYMGGVDCVMVGCEVILENGCIINRAGTLMVAIIAAEFNKPLYVFGQSYKFLRKSYLRQNQIPQQFVEDINVTSSHLIVPADLTPSKYIRLFCTDLGVFSPSGVIHQLSQIFI